MAHRPYDYSDDNDEAIHQQGQPLDDPYDEDREDDDPREDDDGF